MIKPADAKTAPETALDAALAALCAAEEAANSAAQEGALRAYHATLAAQELFLPLEGAESAAAALGQVTPRVLALASGAMVPAFDTEARMAEMLPEGAEFVALRGRDLVQALAGTGGLGLALNVATPQAAYLLPPEAVGWLAALTAPPPPPLMAPESLRGMQPQPPVGVPGLLAGLLALCLGRWPGVAKAALLAQLGTEHSGSGTGRGAADLPLLALIAPPEPLPEELLQELAEAARLASHGGTGAGLAVMVLPEGHPLGKELRTCARALPVPPAPPQPKALPGAAPGLDPARPPRLK